MARDYYEVLGVKKRASARELKQAFRALARECHPDVTGDDPSATAQFKEITEAYETLSDPARRKRYDLFGGPGTTTSPSPFDGFADITGAVDVLKDLFRRGDDEPVPGTDLELDVRVTFRQAYEGASVEVAFPGPGSTAKAPRLQKLNVTVPPGVDDESRLRLREKGAAGKNDGPPGDLFLRVLVEDDERFYREGNDLHTEVPVGLRDVLLGGRVDVPTPTGSVTMTVPAGSQGGQVFRLKDRGFPDLGKKDRGDLLVTLQIRIPTKLNATAHRLVQELDEAVGGNL